MAKKLKLLLFLSIFIFFNNTYSQTEVFWAGIGFLGKYSESEKLYPLSSKINDKMCGKKKCLEAFSREVFNKKDFENFKINFKDLAEVGKDKIGIALGIAYERISTEIVNHDDGDEFLTNFTIFGNIIFLNLDDNNFVGSVPVFIRYSYASPNELKDNEKFDLFEKLLLTNELEFNFTQEAAHKLKNYKLPEKDIRFSQIIDFSIDNQAKTDLELNIDSQLWLSQLAQIYEAYLVENTGIFLLPNAIGHVVGNKLKTKLSSGSREIIIPDTNTKIKASIQKAKVFEKEDKFNFTKCHAIRMNFVVLDAFDAKTLDSSLINAPCNLIRKENLINNFVTFEKSIIGLLYKVTEALESPKGSKDFFKEAVTDGADDVYKQFIETSSYLKNDL